MSEALTERLTEIVGATYVSTDRDVLDGRSVDHTGRYRGRASVLVRPGSTDEVAAVLRACRDAGVAVTVQGGRNSRMGRLLGAGWHYRQAKAERMKDETVEGAELALSVGPTLERMMEEGALAKRQMPLTSAIIDAISRDHEFAVDWQRFHYAH